MCSQASHGLAQHLPPSSHKPHSMGSEREGPGSSRKWGGRCSSPMRSARTEINHLAANNYHSLDQTLHFCEGFVLLSKVSCTLTKLESLKSPFAHPSHLSVLPKLFFSYLISPSFGHLIKYSTIYFFPERTAILSALQSTFNLNSTCNHSRRLFCF